MQQNSPFRFAATFCVRSGIAKAPDFMCMFRYLARSSGEPVTERAYSY
jgi:hypothetical protein